MPGIPSYLSFTTRSGASGGSQRFLSSPTSPPPRGGGEVGKERVSRPIYSIPCGREAQGI